ncbi:hypothetical protein K9L27_03410 [Candidatus Gracilibacteria bacterium]|nr:hypothetical protein [Candidatus Gracilibacteria bacterium]
MADMSLLPKLIQISGVLSPEQKRNLLAQLADLDDRKKDEIYRILEEEQQKKHALYQEMMDEKTEFEATRSTIVRSYIERRDGEFESNELLHLEEELKAVA